ncbi:MAG: hypothetical protein KZQ58_08650 [gamma proteobacterium symbiont of Bathyaustriella thionipta]|nr:hypothetical protein [gamma proteobacterium symbiont of Bathyaustriella thionipta]
MNKYNCEQAQLKLDEMQPLLLAQDALLVEHLQSCPHCRQHLNDLQALQQSLQDLPEQDASEKLVRQTLANIRAMQPAQSARPGVQPRQRWAALVASIFVVIAVGSLLPDLLRQVAAPFSHYEAQITAQMDKDYASAEPAPAAPPVKANNAPLVSDERFANEIDSLPEKQDASAPVGFNKSEQAVPEFEQANKAFMEEDVILSDEGSIAATHFREEHMIRSKNRFREAHMIRSKNRKKIPARKMDRVEQRLANEPEKTGFVSLDGSLSAAETGQGYRKLDPQEEWDSEPNNNHPPVTAASAVNRISHQPGPVSAPPQSKVKAVRPAQFGKPALSLPLDTNRSTNEQNPAQEQGAATTPALQQAQNFLAENARIEGLHFQPASGYWENTYTPGDPSMRALLARLQSSRPQSIAPGLMLDKAALQNWQPFDPPENASLALYLQADQAAIQGSTRLRLQVGIQGTERPAGLRPPMNIALVLDLRDVPASSTGKPYRALLKALLNQRQPGDHFSLIVAGRAGGLLVSADEFRHGPVQLAMNDLFDKQAKQDKQGLSLLQALRLAEKTARLADNPGAVLGSSMILLVSAHSMDRPLPALLDFAHHSATKGIPLSVALLANGQADLQQVDQLVRAGQGNRRILHSLDEADTLIDKELHAASQAVARAVRVRIRLAPGVKLINVLGSQRLNQQQSTQVKQAEKSLDLRMARNLGIRTDRGDDEEGIQIVIPSFYAGDSHVILLDVVAEQPGFIADAQIRYKDLVHPANRLSSVRLSLPEGEPYQGPLQLGVLKNHLAYQLSRQTRLASQALRRGQRPLAIQHLTDMRDLLQGMRHTIPGWLDDAELKQDENMLNNYLSLLQNHTLAIPATSAYVADSLAAAASRKLLPTRH